MFQNKRLDIGLSSYVENHVNVFRFQTPALPWNKLFYNDLKTLIGKRLFPKFMRTYGVPDLIHVHSFLAGDIALWINKQYDIPFIVTEHFSYFQDGTLKAWQNKLAKRLFAKSKANFAVSLDTANVLQKRYGCSVKYLPNIVDSDFFFCNQRKQLESSSVVFLAMGSLDKNKNHEMLIRAFKRAFPDSDARLNIIGTGPLRNHLLKVVKK